MHNTREVSTEQLLGNIEILMNATLSLSTNTTYKGAWDQFNLFSVTILGTVMIPPLTVSKIS